jgi:hypothetical protein
VLTHAYGESGRSATITTAKDAVVNRDTSLFSTRAGYIKATSASSAAKPPPKKNPTAGDE